MIDNGLPPAVDGDRKKSADVRQGRIPVKSGRLLSLRKVMVIEYAGRRNLVRRRLTVLRFWHAELTDGA